MEQWNKKQELVSLREILLLPIYEKKIEEMTNINISFMSEGEILDLVERQKLENTYFYDELSDLEGLVDTARKILVKIFDSLVGDHNLVLAGRSEAVYTEDDMEFLRVLYKLHKSADDKLMRKNKPEYNKIDIAYLNIVKRGLDNLAKNENLKLTPDVVEERWEKVKYDLKKQEVINYGKLLQSVVEEWLQTVADNPDNIALCDEMIELLDGYIDGIMPLRKKAFETLEALDFSKIIPKK